MKKRKLIMLTAVLFAVCAFIYFLYLPKSIDGVLRRIDYPFEVGEIVATQQIEANTTVVLYINEEDTRHLQSAVIRKYGIFYRDIDNNGSITLETPKRLDSGELRTRVLISWYDKAEKYVVMAVAYDEDVGSIRYNNQTLESIRHKGYQLFYGYGTGDYSEYELYDQNGTLLENHLKP